MKKYVTFTSSLWLHRELWRKLTVREIQGRYRGSILGWGWSFITPLLMLAVYTFVFSEVFQARWGDLEPAGSLGFAINLFTGLIVFSIFAETADKSPTLVLNNANLVTKTIFPVEILSAVSIATAFFHAFTSLIVLFIFQLISQGGVPPSTFWLPLVWLPLAGGCLGLSWTLAALGVYIRDLQQISSVIVNLAMFLSAVFYPLSALPTAWQPLLQLNPLVTIIEQTRLVAVNGTQPSPIYLGVGSLLGLMACELGFRAFQRARRGFADVI